MSLLIVTGFQFSEAFEKNIHLPPLQMFISRNPRVLCVNSSTASTDDYRGLCKVLFLFTKIRDNYESGWVGPAVSRKNNWKIVPK